MNRPEFDSVLRAIGMMPTPGEPFTFSPKEHDHDSHVLLWMGFDLAAAGIYDHDIEPCPWCHSNMDVILSEDEHPTLDGRFESYVICGRCGARGPLDARESGALRRWDALPRPEA